MDPNGLDAALRSLPGGGVSRDLLVYLFEWLLTAAILAPLSLYVCKKVKSGAWVVSARVTEWSVERKRKERGIRIAMMKHPVSAMAYLARHQLEMTVFWIGTIVMGLVGLGVAAAHTEFGNYLGVAFLLGSLGSEMMAIRASNRITDFCKEAMSAAIDAEAEVQKNPRQPSAPGSTK